MFGLLSSSQIYGLQQAHEQHTTYNNCNSIKSKSNSLPTNNKPSHQQQQHRRSSSSLSDTAAAKTEGGSKFFATLSAKSPTNFIEKFIKSELLNGYDTLKNFKNYQPSVTSASNCPSPATSAGGAGKTPLYSNLPAESILNSFNCLQGSYRSNCDGEFYEAVHVKARTPTRNNCSKSRSPEMTIRCSKNLLADTPQSQSPATLQNYQKLPEYEHDLLVVPQPETGSSSLSSGASSGEFNTDSAGYTPATNIYKKLSFGARLAKHGSGSGSGSAHSDNSSSSLTTSTATTRTQKSSEVQRSSSDSSTNDGGGGGNNPLPPTPERAQRRKFLQMISNYDQQNKLLQRELAKEKRRRTEELACVVKSLICFESKLKMDMKVVNQRLYDKDGEICRLVRQNRALKKRIEKMVLEKNGARDEGVVEDREDEEIENDCDTEGVPDDVVIRAEQSTTMIDCLMLEALQCNNCRKQFYDIELIDNATQTTASGTTAAQHAIGNESGRSNADLHHLHHHHHHHSTRREHGSSSDDTVSSSFYGARRSVRYTSKRTSGTFRDYMRSRSMNIDDPSLEQNSEENTSTISRDDSQTSSYEHLHNYSRHMERMHGVKGQGVGGSSSNDSRCASRLSGVSAASKVPTPASQLEEDDGIFSPTQDDEDFDEYDDVDLVKEEAQLMTRGAIKIVPRRSAEFSEASPKQIYETSTDDWYASASDQEDMAAGPAKPYGHGAVNPVLECVNQILLQQSMEESVPETPKAIPDKLEGTLPRRSSLSGRRDSCPDMESKRLLMPTGRTASGNTMARKRVHFSTKNSMVHVPRNDSESDEEEGDEKVARAKQQTPTMISHYHPMTGVNSGGGTAPPPPPETLNYESIYSNEYEPIGSEHTSNLYVDMDAASASKGGAIIAGSTSHGTGDKLCSSKLPPALPPKPANLLKFKKSLQQLDEVSDEQEQANCTAPLAAAAGSEPDYCSISEVNGVTGMPHSVQIIADIHKAPPSNASTTGGGGAPSDLELEVSTVASDDTFAASQKTETEIEEIFADIPKLPNVAAIIAPKQSKHQATTSDYLTMTAATAATATTNRIGASLVEAKLAQTLKLPLTPTTTSNNATCSAAMASSNAQYKRKHSMPIILAEINKRMSLPSSLPIITSPSSSSCSPQLPASSSKTLPLNTPTKTAHQAPTYMDNSPLQAEFDWYNLDAEYGKAAQHHSVSNVNEAGGMLAEIQEDSESLSHTADEYNLDEEFKLSTDEQDQAPLTTATCTTTKPPRLPGNHLPSTKAKKMKKNLANFEKFIEGSGLSTKPLPSKRKIYFAGPFV